MTDRKDRAPLPGVSSGAVFLSYASEDAPAAERIAAALRNAGIEVWFDKSELRGGDAWDRRIREEILGSRLFIPIISTHTEVRDEGYFRREWRLAVERAGDMADKKAFLLPVVIDGTSERGASVPEKFRELQWTRLPAGETARAFVERVQRLLFTESLPRVATALGGSEPSRTIGSSRTLSSRSRRILLAFLVVLIVGAASFYWATVKRGMPKQDTSAPAIREKVAPAAFAPPPHSIAVLPFVNMSGDKEQEYFSDGLSEELLNDLARINELQVAARTSAFSFKGKDTDISTIAHKLNVGAVLEGSVRRSGHTIRITAQLINAVTGFHLWSETYDRDMGDVLKLQTDIATAVVSALKGALLGNVAVKVEVGGTHNPAALDAYLRAEKAFREAALEEQGLRDAIARYGEAIQRDPDYAICYASRSLANLAFARIWAVGESIRVYRQSAQDDARKAISLAPDLAEGHLALAAWLEDTLDFPGADQEYTRALTLAPGDTRVLNAYGTFAVQMGRFEKGLEAAHRSVVLDPLNFQNYMSLGISEMFAQRYHDALEALKEAKTLVPENAQVNSWLGYTYYSSGDLQSARSACESGDKANRSICLSMVYNKLGRQADAESLVSKLQAERGDESAVFYAMIYAQWGKTGKALDWLDTAMRRRDPYLKKLKVNASFDPLRKEPRFQAIVRALKFPD